jgi:TonB-linked SusC/RagA family outer membrane protein
MKKILKCTFAILFLFTASLFTVMAQERKLTGTVSGEQGEPLVGVSVSIVGANRGTVTDANGNYTLPVAGKGVIKFSYLGFKSQVLNIGEERSVLNVTLEEDVIALEETVVYAMDMRRDERSVATAVQKVDVESMTESKDVNLLNMLSGKAANLQVISNGGPGSSTRVIIRGNNSLTGNNQPLYVVDGIPIINEMGGSDNSDLDYGNPANNINPDDIEDLTVLKGANAAALYGSDAANGVILITTKKAKKNAGLGVTVSSNLQFNTIIQYPTYQNIYGVGQGGELHQGFNFYTTNSSPYYDPDQPWGIVRLYSGGYNQRSHGFPMLGFDIVGRNGEIRKYSPAPDNVIGMYKTGLLRTNSISFEKTTDAVSLRFSYTNTNTDDLLENFNLINKNSFNLRTTTRLAEYLSVDANVMYNNEQATNRGFRNASDRNPLYKMAWMPRDITKEEMTPWKNPDGTSIVFPGGFYNPYWLLNELSNEDTKHWLLADVAVNLTLSKSFRLRLKGATDMNTSQGWSFTNMYSPFDIEGDFGNFSELYRNNTLEALLSYNRRWGNFNLSASAGAWGQNYVRRKESARIETLLQPDVKSLSNNGAMAKVSEDYNSKMKQALFATASLGYKDFIYLDITGRNDWSSALSAENRSYFYSSAGVSFVLTEAFRIPKNILSFAKFRFSTATVGNDTGFDMLLDGYSYGNIYLGDMPWFQSDNLKKKRLLKPEQTISNEMGADLRFLDNRIRIDVTYYTKSTRDQILRSDIPYASGYSQAMYNAGEVKNWGTELSLQVVPVKTRNFEWTTRLNWANNQSKIVSLANDMEYMLLAQHHGLVQTRAVVGRSYGTLYGNDLKRDENGDPLVLANGRAQEVSGVLLGDVSPDWIGGWNNAFRLGDLEASFLLDFKKGGLIWSATMYQASRDGQSIESLRGRDEFLFSRWILGENNEEIFYNQLNRDHTNVPGATHGLGPNDNGVRVPYFDSERVKGTQHPNAHYDPEFVHESVAGLPSYANISPHNYWTDDCGKNPRLFLYDASFIKLREVSVGYNCPKKWLNRIGFIRSLKISAVGRNLAILYQKTPQGLDPEATTSMGNGQGVENGFNLPSATYGFNIKATF